MSFEEFCKIISEISKVPLDQIQKESSFRDHLDVDSLQMVNLILELTTILGIENIKIRSNEDFATVWSLYQLVISEENKI
ncbi:acyl carrier protein [Niallia sp. Krafla_26]|uniref:acyl carrier protein n=1 Tax=Niallia sp. Krafla_26 TaxID=3064703 RepID=UPI003D184203